jgi:hypothetical protein
MRMIPTGGVNRWQIYVKFAVKVNVPASMSAILTLKPSALGNLIYKE